MGEYNNIYIIKYNIAKMLGTKELDDITPWRHNNYKSPIDKNIQPINKNTVYPHKKI